MPRQKTLAETLRDQMRRESVSTKELARRIAGADESKVPTAHRKVKRLRAGTTQSIKPETAAELEKALGTRGVFTQFVEVSRPRGTQAIAEELRRELQELRDRVARLERTG